MICSNFIHFRSCSDNFNDIKKDNVARKLDMLCKINAIYFK